jgi:hypothetical protein
MVRTGASRRFWATIAGISLAGALFAACGGDANEPPATVTIEGDQASTTISMKDHYFEPSRIVVPVGMPVTVTVANEGAAVHNLRVSAGESDTFEMRFPAAGSSSSAVVSTFQA